MGKIEEVKEKIKENPQSWEEVIFHFACSLACELTKEVLAGMDDELAREKTKNTRVVSFKEKWVMCLFGDVKFKRRLYRDSDGGYHFLLDEKIGLDKGSHVSPVMKRLAVEASTNYTFREVEQNIKAVFPWAPSHTTVHNLSGKVADSYIEEEQEEVKALYEDGVIPESEDRVSPYLFMEADGVNISLQREKGRKAEIKAGIAYEGWEEITKERYKLKEKSVYGGIMSGERFWQGFSLILAKKYDLSRIDKVIVGGDGAPWVKVGAELFGGLYELDRFHLRRTLYQGLCRDPLAGDIYGACIKGDIAMVEKLLIQAQQGTDKERAKEIMKLRGYLMDNCYGLRDYRLEVSGDGLRGLGAMEGNVDKLFADRMKKRGMSWTKKGANRMAKLISLNRVAKLEVGKRSCAKPTPALLKKGVDVSQKKFHERDGGDWLQAETPAFYGPHSDRPWVHVLRALVYGDNRNVAYAGHPEIQPTKS
jgi:hypothetical protein